MRSTKVDTSVPTAPTGAPASSFSAVSTGVSTALSTGASFTAVTLMVVVAATALSCEPSFTVHVMVRVGLAPKLVGLSLVDLNVIESRRAWYAASDAVPLAERTPVSGL